MLVRTRIFIYLFIYLLNHQQKKEKRLLTLTFFYLLLVTKQFRKRFNLKLSRELLWYFCVVRGGTVKHSLECHIGIQTPL